MNTLLKMSAALLVACPLVAMAQSNPAFIEKSQIVGAGNELQLFGLPAKDSTGKIKYWDTTITLTIDSLTGKPTASSTTVSVPQAKAKSTEFVVGSYSGTGANCSLVRSPFNGRTQFDLTCLEVNNSHTSTFTWYSGRIAGHPWEADLVAAGLDQLIGNQEYSWGKQLQSNSQFSATMGCFYIGNLISARQVGNTLTLVNYGNDSTFNCQASFDLSN